MDSIELRLLGPLEARVGDRPVTLGGTKQRALLARLLLDAGRSVTVDRLVDDLWDEPPETAAKMVQVYVSRLRKLLPGGTLETRGGGYQLTLAPESADLQRFDRLRADGRRALDQGRYESAARDLREALALWRGTPLAEFPAEPFARTEAARLEELRTAVLEDRIDADLELGRHAGLVAELEALVAHHPLRERLRGQLMLALYRSGRQAEALAAQRSFRELLAGELGMEPSPALKELERRMLQQDATLEVKAPARAEPTARPRPSAGAMLVPSQAEIRYARNGDVGIAYQVIGDGPLDLVLVHGWVCTFQPGWEDPLIARFYRRLASLGRLILFDKRGTGLSDRVSPDRLPDLETRMDDVRAVMDAAGSERAVLLGISEGGPMSVLFAATHPERTAALVLLGTFARLMWAPDYPIGISDAEQARRLGATDTEDWARDTTAEWLGRVAPSLPKEDPRYGWYRSYVMRGASPAGAKALRLMNAEIDIRNVLPAVGVPTLVAYREREWFAAASQYLGEGIHGARVVALPGNDHLPWEGDQDELLNEIERFLAGIQDEVEPDRVLVTLLVTDIVGSTAAAAELGDRAWRDLVERHYAVVRAQLGRFRGHEIDSAGDGILAVFDGPARAVRCGSAILGALRPLGLELRAGVHTGEVERAGDRLRGIAVHIAARVAARAGPNEVLVSQTVKDLVAGSGLEFEDRGEHELYGVPGEWRLHAVAAGAGATVTPVSGPAGATPA